MQTQVAKGRSEGERVVSLRRSASNESCGRKVMTLVHGVVVGPVTLQYSDLFGESCSVKHLHFFFSFFSLRFQFCSVLLKINEM